MGDVINFPKRPRRKRGEMRRKGTTLCKSGFHRWDIDQKKQFDVKHGCLVTIRRCVRCGHTKTTLD